MNDAKFQPGEPPVLQGLPNDVIISSDTLPENRVPPRQARTRKWPVPDAFGPPKIDLAKWKFQVKGLVDMPSWDWHAIQALPRVWVFSDFHCVTRWSRLGNLWEGVRTSELLNQVKVLPAARYVLVSGHDWGWTTNLPLEAFLAEDALFADRHEGEPIPVEHGGPLRLVVPKLHAWKGAKWVSGVEFLEADQAGTGKTVGTI